MDNNFCLILCISKRASSVARCPPGRWSISWYVRCNVGSSVTPAASIVFCLRLLISLYLIWFHVIPHQTFTFGFFRWNSLNTRGWSDLQILTSYVLSFTETWNVVLSVKLSNKLWHTMCLKQLFFHGFIQHQIFHLTLPISVFLNLWAIAQFSSGPRAYDKSMLDYSYINIQSLQRGNTLCSAARLSLMNCI